jgi:hypothetical protein
MEYGIDRSYTKLNKRKSRGGWIEVDKCATVTEVRVFDGLGHLWAYSEDECHHTSEDWQRIHADFEGERVSMEEWFVDDGENKKRRRVHLFCFVCWCSLSLHDAPNAK